MTRYSRTFFARSSAGPALAVALLVVLAARTGQGAHVPRDLPILMVGQGTANSDCVLPGTGGTLETTTPAGDDFVSGNRVLSGQNGICETSAAATDVQALPVGHGLPNGALVLSGTGAADDGICDSTPQGDDALRIPVGRSTPNQVAVTAGPNRTLDTTAAGDDVAGPQ